MLPKWQPSPVVGIGHGEVVRIDAAPISGGPPTIQRSANSPQEARRRPIPADGVQRSPSHVPAGQDVLSVAIRRWPTMAYKPNFVPLQSLNRRVFQARWDVMPPSPHAVRKKCCARCSICPCASLYPDPAAAIDPPDVTLWVAVCSTHVGPQALPVMPVMRMIFHLTGGEGPYLICADQDGTWTPFAPPHWCVWTAA